METAVLRVASPVGRNLDASHNALRELVYKVGYCTAVCCGAPCSRKSQQELSIPAGTERIIVGIQNSQTYPRLKHLRK